MPRARRKSDRLRQIFNWLQEEYPVGPVKLSLLSGRTQEQKDHFGWVEKGDRALVIYLVRTHPLDCLVETLIHEYAHVLCWPRGGTHKSREWTTAYGKLYHRFYDCEGWQDSEEVAW